jgi:hypothetical protein
MDLTEVAKSGVPADAIAGSERHPWERVRAEFVVKQLRSEGLFERSHPMVTMLDVGAGDGYVAHLVARELPPLSRATAWDTEYTATQVTHLSAASPSMAFTKSRPAGRFSLLLLLDVLEHVADDHAFLANLLAESAEHGACVLVTVPAWPSLFGAHDRFLRHERRYTPTACASLLRKTGLTITREGGLFATLLPLRAAAIVAERAGIARGRAPQGVALGSRGWRGGPTLSAIVGGVLRADAALSDAASRLPMSLRLPGLSYFALCTTS